jgi:hypothetical protein
MSESTFLLICVFSFQACGTKARICTIQQNKLSTVKSISVSRKPTFKRQINTFFSLSQQSVSKLFSSKTRYFGLVSSSGGSCLTSISFLVHPQLVLVLDGGEEVSGGAV